MDLIMIMVKGKIVVPMVVMILSAHAGLAQFANQKLAESKEGSSPLAGPRVAIGIKNPSHMAVSVSGNRVIYTLDESKTWMDTQIPSGNGEASNATLVSDLKGRLYNFNEVMGPIEGGGNYTLVVRESEDAGKSWSEPAPLVINPPKDNRGLFALANPKKGILYAAWTQFDQYGFDNPNALSSILFSSSSNGGKKWSKPAQISQTPGNCLDDDNTARGISVGINADGRLFAAWSNQGMIFLDRSYDDGSTWLSTDVVVTKQHGGSSMKIPGVNGAVSFPELKVDGSPKRSNGSLYLVFADQREGENDTDVWFVRSTSRGDSWTMPLRVNQDGKGKHQFMPSMATDPTTGGIFILYYDRRDSEGLETSVYLAHSMDGGNIFNDVKISDTPFVADENLLTGKSLSIAAHGGVIAAVWIRTDDGKATLWGTVIKEQDLAK